ALLRRPARHPRGSAQCRRRRHLHRPPLRHVRRAPHRSCADRRQAPRGEARRHHHVRRRRHGRSGPFRGSLIEMANVRWPWLFFGVLLVASITSFSLTTNWATQSWLDLAAFLVSVLGIASVLLYS